MCGIVGAIAQRNITGILVEGLKRLEYRGYDSSGIAVLTQEGIRVCRQKGKVANIDAMLSAHPLKGLVGIAHTRWATHGVPSEANAHPHLSYDGRIAIIHNGIIENYEALKKTLEKKGVHFASETDSEVAAHTIADLVNAGASLFDAIQAAAKTFSGNNGIAAIDQQQPDKLVVLCSGSPIVIGVGIEENFIASDTMALRQVTDRFVFLEEGDIAELTTSNYRIFNNGKRVERKVVQVSSDEGVTDKGEHAHYMIKEIYEQPVVLARTIAGRLLLNQIVMEALDEKLLKILAQVEAIHIVACGTSYHAGLLARHWIEQLAEVPCTVDIASEYRYRKVLVEKNTLFLSISQSGETADTLAALRGRRSEFMATLAICNMANSSLVRESDCALMTYAGLEIGVASTKAFTTQLVAAQILALALAKIKNKNEALVQQWTRQLHQLPVLAEGILSLDDTLRHIAPQFANKHHALFLGRGVMYPVAMEGALKLKEISYIHAEAYAAGELKHGPLALVDEHMPVIAVAPNNALLEKLKSNLQEVRARGGKLYVFADKTAGFENTDDVKVISLPHVPESLAPILYTIPLQLLSYYVALIKGTDVDKPRNLAKSVTVE
jgi:glucosamine--fructose-6-phosphate aminotransferase (isomerizing)